MNRSIAQLFLIVLFCSAAFAQNAGTIRGTVRLGNETTVLHRVSVRLVELKRSTVTDNSGEFSFADVPPGQYTITAHQEGFRDVTKKVELTGQGSASVDFQLQIAGLKEQVTVSGSGTEESVFESIAAVSTVNSSQIIERAAVGLGDVLNNQGGVSKRSSGPGNSRPVIRGFDGDRVLVSNDGVRVGSLASQSGDHSEPVDTLAVERIEVVKGPATLLYGSNAIGGVVNAISGHDEPPHPGLRGYLSGIGGANNGHGAASGGIEYGVGRFMLWGNGSGQRTGDYKAGGDFGKVLNSFTRSRTGEAGIGYFANKSFFNANYNYYQSRYGIPFDFNDPDSGLKSLRLWRGDAKFNFGYNDVDWFVTGIKFTADFSNYRHQELEDGFVGTTYRNKVSSIRGMFEQKKTGRLSGRFGFEGFHRTFSTVGDEILIDGPVIQNSFSVFGLEELKLDRVSLQFGGRLEKNRYNPKNPRYIDRNFTGFSGSVGAKIRLWDGGLFVANYSHGYRAAALEELYNNGPHDGSLSFEIGNPNLKPEISDGIDFSVRHQNSRFKAEANYYYYSFKNFVFLAPTGVQDAASGFEIARYLQGDSRFTGTELSLDVTAHKYVSVLTGFDYVNAQLATGQPLPRIAPMRGRIGLDLHYQNFSLRPEFLTVGRQDRVFNNETPTAGYGTANLTASYILAKTHAAHVFSLSAYNLNNKLYYNHISFIKELSPEIGRGLRFSYTVRFF